jgi:hypothetical protein
METPSGPKSRNSPMAGDRPNTSPNWLLEEAIKRGPEVDAQRVLHGLSNHHLLLIRRSRSWGEVRGAVLGARLQEGNHGRAPARRGLQCELCAVWVVSGPPRRVRPRPA